MLTQPMLSQHLYVSQHSLSNVKSMTETCRFSLCADPFPHNKACLQHNAVPFNCEDPKVLWFVIAIGAQAKMKTVSSVQCPRDSRLLRWLGACTYSHPLTLLPSSRCNVRWVKWALWTTGGSRSSSVAFLPQAQPHLNQTKPSSCDSRPFKR